MRRATPPPSHPGNVRQGVGHARQRGKRGMRHCPSPPTAKGRGCACVTHWQNVLDEMFQEADADKDGRIRSAPPCTQRPLSLTHRPARKSFCAFWSATFKRCSERPQLLRGGGMMCARAVRDMCCGSRLFCSVWWHLHKYTVQHGDFEPCVAAR